MRCWWCWRPPRGHGGVDQSRHRLQRPRGGPGPRGGCHDHSRRDADDQRLELGILARSRYIIGNDDRSLKYPIRRGICPPIQEPSREVERGAAIERALGERVVILAISDQPAARLFLLLPPVGRPGGTTVDDSGEAPHQELRSPKTNRPRHRSSSDTRDTPGLHPHPPPEGSNQLPYISEDQRRGNQD